MYTWFTVDVTHTVGIRRWNSVTQTQDVSVFEGVLLCVVHSLDVSVVCFNQITQ